MYHLTILSKRLSRQDQGLSNLLPVHRQFGLFASAGSDVVRYATSLAGRAAGNIIGAGRTEMVVEGFVNGIRNSWQNMWDMWRNKDEIIQGRANKVSLRTFTEDMIQSNKLNTIGEKRLTTGAEIKQYKRIAKTVSDLNGLNKAFQDYSEGKMDEATWNERYTERPRILSCELKALIPRKLSVILKSSMDMTR